MTCSHQFEKMGFNDRLLLKGVTIGRRSVIGANAVVTHDIPPYSVAVGIPARVISRFSTADSEHLSG